MLRNQMPEQGGKSFGAQYPRVLMINSQSMYKNNATGITLRALWEDWPIDAVMEIHMGRSKYSVSAKEGFRSISPARNSVRKLVTGKGGQSVNNNLKTDTTSANPKKWKNKLRQVCICIMDCAPVGFDSKQKEMIDAFRPQIIYTLGASVSVMRLAHSMAHRYQIPMIIHFMDNWPEHIQWEDNPLLKPYTSLIRLYMKRCLAHSQAGIAISPSMAQHYSELFNLPFEILMNSVDEEKIQTVSVGKRGDEKHFVYAGGLHLDRWKALCEIGEAIGANCENAVLDIYTPERDREMHESAFRGMPVVFHDPVPHERMNKVWAEADVLVHAESNSSKILVRFFKYSISTKIPEYMATGKPVLFYGPKEMGLYRYLEENQAALVASEKEELEFAVKMIYRGDDMETMINNAINLVRKNHRASAAKKKLLDVIAKSCNNG